MTNIWMMTGAFDVMERAMQLDVIDQPPGIVIENRDTLHEVLDDIYYPRLIDARAGDVLRLSTMPPAAILTITAPDFAPDYFNVGHEFVSARARAAMALADDDVQWLPVDAAGSTAEARAQDYRILLAPHIADPFDHDASDGDWIEPTAPGGAARQWRLRMPDPSRPPPKVQWREDFVAPAPLFRVAPLGGALFATEALAARVRDAGIRDIVFVDAANDGTRSEVLLRPD